MAIIHQRSIGLPPERVRLYAEAMRVLIERWQKLKGIAPVAELQAVLNDDRRLRPVLERLAFEAHQWQSRQREADLPRGELLQLLEQPHYLGDVALASGFLDYIDQRAGVLVGRGGDESGAKPKTYSFVHRTFQEYLAGCHLVTGRARDRAAAYRQRAEASDYWSLAALLGAEHLLYVRESPADVLDLAYDLCPEQEPVGAAGWRAVLWAGRMAALLGRDAILRDNHAGGGAVYLDRLLARLVLALSNGVLPAIERAEAGRALGRLGDPRPEATDLDGIAWCPVPAGWFQMGSSDADTDSSIRERPLHWQNIGEPFRISRFPITQAQFAAFVVDPHGYQNDKWWTRWDCNGGEIGAQTWRMASRTTCPIILL